MLSVLAVVSGFICNGVGKGANAFNFDLDQVA
jgi:hypothetical protein